MLWSLLDPNIDSNRLCCLKGELYWRPLPFVCYGASALASALLMLIFVPETKYMEMTDTLD
jgi:hypothetical protein